MGPAVKVDDFGVVAPLPPLHPRPQPRVGALAAVFFGFFGDGPSDAVLALLAARQGCNKYT